jgi:hypothetical protein
MNFSLCVSKQKKQQCDRSDVPDVRSPYVAILWITQAPGASVPSPRVFGIANAPGIKCDQL